MAVHNEAKKELLAGTLGTTFKMILLAHTYTPDVDNHVYYDDIISHEISATGYTAGGQTLANVTVSKDNSTDKAKLDADDVTWTNLDLTSYSGTGQGAAYIAILKSTGDSATSTVVQTKHLKNSGGTDATFNGNYASFPVPIPTQGIIGLV